MVFNIRLISKNFQDIEEICHQIQFLINFSKYNLKRSSKTQKSNSITFVCSCNSRKKMNSSKENFWRANSENSPDSQNLETCCSGYRKRRREVKRFNAEACRFRIRFKKNANSDITFVRESNIYHNHAPSEKKTSKVSWLTLYEDMPKNFFFYY